MPLIDVCLLSVWIFAPKWIPLYRKTAQLDIFMWEQYWLEKKTAFDSSTQRSPGATAYLWKLNTGIFIISIASSESQPGRQKHLSSHFPPTGYLFFFSTAFASLPFGCLSTVRTTKLLKASADVYWDWQSVWGSLSCWSESGITPMTVTTHSYMGREVSCCSPVGWF